MEIMEIMRVVFDVVGTIAFAISGTLIGITRRMDIFGMMVLALATAIGGGVIRDVLVGQIPPQSLRSSEYVLMTIAVTTIVFIIYKANLGRHLSGKWMQRSYLLADAIGLGSFTVTGTSVGYISYPQLPVFCVLLGLLTAVGGGMIRDTLANRTPSVLREEVYALPAIIGGVVFYLVSDQGYYFFAPNFAFLTTFGIRMLALKYKWNLPHV